MHKIKLKRIYTDILNDEEINLINKIYMQCNKKKLNKAKKNFQYFDSTELLEKFSEIDELNDLELDILNKVIIIYKTFYSNMDSLIKDDIPYDRALNILKKYRPEPIVENLVVSRRVHDTVHEFPELKGTLDKSNVKTDVMCYRDSDKSLESYLRKWFNDIEEDYIRIVETEKFDGNSGVGTVDEKGNLISMVSRGEDGKGSDLTHLFKDRKFKADGKRRGVQFEIVMTEKNFKKYCKKTNKEYANLRVAVSSILTSSNGAKYAKYLSLVPIKLSDGDLNNHEMFMKLNDLYATDIKNYQTPIKETNLDRLLSICFSSIDNINKSRAELGYAIDGVVFECTNPSIIKKYGRKNNINRYMVAFKFPPQIAYPKVTGLKVTIGRTGLATPNLYYTTTYFNKNKYDHSSISSAKRVDKLKLRLNDIIKLTYNGDVMPYPDSYKCKDNDDNKSEFIMFPKKCNCGSEFKRLGANYYCTNPKCEEKKYSTIAYFYTTIGVKDVKEATVEKMIKNKIITGFENCLNPDYNLMYTVEGFGDKKIKNFLSELRNAKENNISEARLMNALGILGEEFSKKILSVIPLNLVLKNKELLYKNDIKGIGEKTKEKFINNLSELKQIITYMQKELNISECKVSEDVTNIVFTGFRDKLLKEKLERVGFNVLDNYNKSVSYVIAKNTSEDSGTIKKAKKNNTTIYTLEEFKDNVLEAMKIDLI